MEIFFLISTNKVILYFYSKCFNKKFSFISTHVVRYDKVQFLYQYKIRQLEGND